MLAGEGAREIAELVRTRKATAEEVLHAHLRRIDRYEPGINAFTAVLAEQALEAARELDGRSDLGELPLAGVPVAIKDNVDVAGQPTRHGSAATTDAPAARDDELVRRLRAAGCVVIGKTRLPELAIWPFTEPVAGGSTHNPWDPHRTAGGSTGGGAAAVAVGMAPLALGSDGGGSIRIPAACCGIVGLKPSPGLLPIAGGDTAHWRGLSAFGPLAVTVADAGLMFAVLAGRPASAHPEVPATPLRIALSTKAVAPGASIQAETALAVEAIGALLEEAGHLILREDPPYPPDIGLRYARRYLAGIAEDAASLPLDKLEKRTRGMVRAGRLLARWGWNGMAAEDDFGSTMLAWFDRCDVLLMPTLAEPAVQLGRYDGLGWIRTMLATGNWVQTPQWNLAGFAGISVPAAMSAKGLPIGAQFITPPGGESLLLSIARQVEDLKGWPHWKPGR